MERMDGFSRRKATRHTAARQEASRRSAPYAGAGAGADGAARRLRGWLRSPRGRRELRRARVLAAALCIAFAVSALASRVSSANATVQVVVAARAIGRGATVAAGDVALAEVPAHAGLGDAVGNLEEIIGRECALDVPEGSLLTAAMLAPAYAAPRGYAVIDVELSTPAAALVPGTKVALSSLAGCDGSSQTMEDSGSRKETGEEKATPDGSDDAGESGGADASSGASASCVIAADAVYLGPSETQDSSGTTANGASGATNRASVALPPDDALAVLQAQDVSPIIAHEP